MKKKEKALKVIIESAKSFQENLANKNILFIIQKDKNYYEFVETIFIPSNFLHLTGIKIIDKNMLGAKDFYERAIHNKLSVNDFEFKNKTTHLKLEILPQIIKIDKTAKIMGNYENHKMFLRTEQMIGNIHQCMGFIKNTKYYIPNTILKEDIRRLISKSNKIVMILKKSIEEERYSDITCLNSVCDELVKMIKTEEIIDNQILDRLDTF